MFRRSIFFFACVLASENPQIWGESVNSINYVTENYFFRKGINILYEKSETSQYLITEITKISKKSYIIINESYPIGRKLKYFYTNDVIVIVQSQKILSVFLKNRHWNPRGRILVIVPNDLEVRDVIEEIWNSTRAVDVVVMKINENIKFYTWFPYKKHECLNVRNVSFLGEWKDGKISRGRALFPAKISKNFEGCPLYAVTTHVPPFVLENYEDGYEIRIIDTIADFHNFKLIFVPLPEGESFWVVNSTVDYAGAMGLLVKHTADIAFGSLMTRSDRNEITDMLYPHIHQNLLWIFPAPGQISSFSSIYTIFSVNLWINIILYHILISFTFYFIVRTVPSREPDSYRNWISCFLTPIALMTNNAVTKPRGFYLRFATMIYVIYALHITTAYTSSLIVLLQNYKTEKPYETVQELIDAGLFCYIYQSAINVFINVTDHHLWNQILQPGRFKYMSGTSADHMKDEVAYRKRAYMLFPKLNIDFTTPGKYQDKRGRSLFDSMPFLSYTTAYFVSPGNPILDILADTLLRIRSGGLTNYWMSTINRYQGTDDLELDDEDEEEQLLPLSIKHLQGAFLFHFIFSMCSVLVLFGEIIFYRKFGKK